MDVCDFDHIQKNNFKNIHEAVENAARLSKGNIALVINLEDKRIKAPINAGHGCVGPNGGKLLTVVNTHIVAATESTDVKMLQSSILLEYLMAWSHAPLLVCGDFNSTPESAVGLFLRGFQLCSLLLKELM